MSRRIEERLVELETRVTEARVAVDAAYDEAGETTPETDDALFIWTSLSGTLRHVREEWRGPVPGASGDRGVAPPTPADVERYRSVRGGTAGRGEDRGNA